MLHYEPTTHLASRSNEHNNEIELVSLWSLVATLSANIRYDNLCVCDDQYTETHRDGLAMYGNTRHGLQSIRMKRNGEKHEV